MNQITKQPLSIDHSPRSPVGEKAGSTLNQLAWAAERGSESAWRKLALSVGPLVMRILRRQGVPQQDRDDLMSEVMRRLYTYLSRLVGSDSKIAAWVSRVARNQACDYHKHRARARSRFVMGDMDPPSTAYTVGAEHIDGARLLELLSSRERAVFELHMRGHRHEEIGEMLGISTEYSRRILADARALLRRTLQGRARDTRRPNEPYAQRAYAQRADP